MLIILCATYEDPNPGRGRAVRWFARIAEIATAECYKTPTQFRTGELAGTPAQGWSQDPSPEHDWRQLEGLVSLGEYPTLATDPRRFIGTLPGRSLN